MRKFIIFILCLLLTGCNTSVSYEKANLFDIEKASDIASEYMNALSKGEIDKADSLCKENKSISAEEAKKLQDNRFKAYKVEETNEGADYSYIKYLVIRGNSNDVRADLDSIELKVSKIDDDYKITEIEAKNLKQVYLDRDNIRIIDGETGKSDLLLRKRDIPKEVFTKGDKVTLTMDTVPEVQFSKINIGFQGKSVGITMTDGNKTLVVLSIINDVKTTESGTTEGTVVNSNEDIEEVLEKPISEKIIGYDLVNGGQTEKILFTDNDEALILQIKKQGEGSQIRIYKNPSGELMNFEIDKRFPPNKYSLDIEKITEEGIYVDALPISSDAEEGGTYVINIKKMELSKDE